MRKSRKGYRRSTDNVVMVEVKPNQFVNVQIALRFNLINPEEEIDVQAQ